MGTQLRETIYICNPREVKAGSVVAATLRDVVRHAKMRDVREEIQQLCGQTKAPTIALDLSFLTGLDSATTVQLLMIESIVSQAGKVLVLYGLQPPVYMTLKAIRLSTRFQIEANLDAIIDRLVTSIG